MEVIAMRKKLCRYLLASVAMACVLCTPATSAHAESQGTDGTEMQVMEAENLEIQLGAGWAGVEFQLKTDSGLYPGTIKVGEDGVLRTELGGSRSYILTCMASSTAAPETAQAPATSEETQMETGNMEDEEQNIHENPENTGSMLDTEPDVVQEPSGETQEEDSITEQPGTVAGIPVAHIILFAGGMVLAVGSLIAMYIMKRRREADDDYEYEDEYDE